MAALRVLTWAVAALPQAVLPPLPPPAPAASAATAPWLMARRHPLPAVQLLPAACPTLAARLPPAVRRPSGAR